MHYYIQYWKAARGTATLSEKCEFILKEPNFWQRTKYNRDWWRRMTCEGDRDGKIARDLTFYVSFHRFCSWWESRMYINFSANREFWARVPIAPQRQGRKSGTAEKMCLIPSHTKLIILQKSPGVSLSGFSM